MSWKDLEATPSRHPVGAPGAGSRTSRRPLPALSVPSLSGAEGLSRHQEIVTGCHSLSWA